MKKIYKVNDSQGVISLFLGQSSRISRTKPALTLMLLIAFGLFGMNEKAWAWGEWTASYSVTMYSRPTAGGYVSNSNNFSGQNTSATASTSKSGVGLTSSAKLSVTLYAQAVSGYKFVGWSTKEDGSNIVSTSTSYTRTSDKMYVTSSSKSETLYAIFAGLKKNTPTTNEVPFGDVTVGEASDWTTFKINHELAGTVTLTKDANGDHDDFVVVATKGADTELSSFNSSTTTSATVSAKTFYVKFKPTDKGLRTCTLTISSNVAGISSLVYVLKGNGYNQPSVTWTGNDSAVLTSGETTLSVGDTLRATTKSGQALSYSEYSNYFNTGTDVNGNPVLIVKSDITGTNATSVKVNLEKGTGTSYYAAYSETFELSVTNLTPQTIEWTNDISDISDEEIGHTITLNAVAKNAKTGANSGQTITYSMAANDYLSLSGNVLTIKAIGGPVAITATAAGNENYAPTSVTKYATVIDMSHPCATSDGHSNGQFNQGNHHDIYPTLPTSITFTAKREKGTLLKDLVIRQYNANGGEITSLRETKSYGSVSTSGTQFTIDSDPSVATIRFEADGKAKYTYYITNITTTRKTESTISVNSLSYETDPGQSLGKQVTVTYSNIPVFLSFKSDEDAGVSSGKSLWSVNTSRFGGCGKKGSQNVTVTFRSNTKGNYTDKLYVRNNVGNLLHTIDLSASVTAQEQILETWNIENTYNTTAQVTLAAATTVGNTDFTFTAISSNPANIVSISNAGVMTFNGSGTATIRAYQPGDNLSQEFETTHNITINKVAPNIAVNPTGTAVSYLGKLNGSTLTGGSADITLRGVANTEVKGTFSWTNPAQQITDNAGTHNYSVTFTPTNGDMYTIKEFTIPIIITRATQALAMNNGTVKVSVDGIDAGASNSYLNLNTLIIASQTTSDVVNNVTRDGEVTYEVISANKEHATISGSTFSATVCGTYTIRATKAQTAYYNQVTADFTVTVEKRANTLATAASYTKYVDDEVEIVATQVNSDGTIHTSSSDATVAYYDVTNNKIVIPNSAAKSFNQKEVTIKIWQDATARFDGIAEADAKTIVVTVKKYDNEFSCSWGSWTKRVNFEDVFDAEFTTNNTDYTHSPIQITQATGATVATLVKNDDTHCTITASYTRDDATWNLYQAENYKYKAATKTGVKVEVRVLPAVCYLYEDNTEHSFSTAITDISGHFDKAVAINGPVKQISFDAKRDISGVDNFVAQYSVDNGANWRDIVMPGISTSYETYGPYDFPDLQDNEKVTHIRFGAKTGATLSKYYKNIKVSRATSIKPEDENGNLVETLVMPQNTIGGTTTAKFYMNYSSCDDVIKIVSNNEHFTVDQPEITVDQSKDYNSAEITVSYTADAKGTHTGTITLYTKYQNRTFTVTGTTDKKVQTLEWLPGFEGNPMTLSVGLVVDNVNKAAVANSERSVVYSTDNADVIKITLGGLGFEVIGTGEATLTASVAEDDYWFPVSESKTVNATSKKIQVIVWNQDLMRGLAPEDVIDLDAKVFIRNMSDGSLTEDATRTPYITYSGEANSVIALNGKQITVLDYGEATIIANVAGNETYEAAQPVTMYVKVRQPSAGCETPLVLDHADNVQLFSMDMQLSGGFGDWTTPEITSDPILLDPTNGKPDKLSYKHNGELYVYGLIKLCRGTVVAQQRVNGVWSDIEGSTYNNGGKEGSEGAYDWRLVEDLQLDENADAIRFRRLDAGQGYHNFKDIEITLKQYLRPTVEVVDLADIEIGEARKATIGFDFSDIKGDLLADKGNPEDVSYSIDSTLIIRDCGAHGHFELPITITPTELGPWSATIVITDNFTNLSTTLTVIANVTEGYKYIFSGGEGEGGQIWNEEDNWNDNHKPGVNDPVIVNSDVVINGKVTVGSLTISDESTVTVTVTGNLTIGSGSSSLLGNYGNLHIEEGGKVTVGTGALLVNDLILDASLGSTSTSAASGQLTDENQKLVLMNDAYFQMSFDPSGQITYGWYDFVVPFEVDIQTGIFREGDLTNHLVSGVDFIVMEHSETARAAGQKDWKVTTGTMLPGRVYTITFDDEVVQNTFLFKKKQGSDLLASDSYQAVCSAGDSDKRGWNGLGNGTLQHKQMKTAGMKVQLYDHTNNVYVTREADEYIFAVGTSFFVQVGGEQEIEFANATNRAILAPARDARTVDEFRLALKAEDEERVVDQLWISASEEATGEYVIGRDLLKMGTPTSAKVAQMWTVSNGQNLCDLEMPLVGNNASTSLNLYAPQAGTYEIAVEKSPADATLYLTQNGNVVWNLSMSPYTIDLTKGTTSGYGLRIVADRQTTTDVENAEIENQGVRKVLIDDKIYIVTPEGKMYDIVGKSVKY